MSLTDQYPFSALLRQFRARAHLSQQALAEQVGLHRHTIRAWEQGSSLPRSRPMIQALAESLRLSASEAETLLHAGSFPQMEVQVAWGAGEPLATFPRYWQVPFPRNSSFTGREALLEEMQQALLVPSPTARPAVFALCGLGGIGKTQLALEYAYRSRDTYQAVLWACAETRATLTSAVLAFAATLGLPEQGEPDQQPVLDAVRRWLRLHVGWLVILDNVHDFALFSEVLPPDYAGQVLLTTQLRATGSVAHALVVEPLTAEEGALLLLRRAKLVTPTGDLAQLASTERGTAEQIADHLGGLPLALDQAGAYLEETGCGLVGYLTLSQRHQAVLLARRGTGSSAHPESVITTISLAFAQVEQASPAAADLLRLCMYLAPEAIPEELFTGGGVDLPAALQPLAVDELHWQETCAVALRYSLLARRGERQVLSLHRLVQGVLRATLEDANKRQWAERVVRLVNHAFPQQVEYANWEQCQRLLPHALRCVELIEEWHCTFPEAAQLLTQTGDYFQQRGAYAQAQPLFERALSLREQALGPAHPDVAESLNNLAEIYFLQGRYAQAQPLFERALSLREQVFGPVHPDVADSLSNLASTSYYLGRYPQALPLYQRALAINEQALGPIHPEVASDLSDLALLYRELGQYDVALPLSQRALAIREHVLGPDHPAVAHSLNNLGLLYRELGQHDVALPLFQRALAIREQALGPDHPTVAVSLNNLAGLYRVQGQYEQALELSQRAITIFEQALGLTHPDVGSSLITLAVLFQVQGQYERALPLYQRALAIKQQALGTDHPSLARCLERYALLLRALQQPAQAQVLETRAQNIRGDHC